MPVITTTWTMVQAQASSLFAAPVVGTGLAVLIAVPVACLIFAGIRGFVGGRRGRKR